MALLDTLPAAPVLAIRRGITIEATPAGLQVAGVGWGHPVAIADPDVRAAILSLLDGPLPSAEIVHRAVSGSGQLSAAVGVQSALRRLQLMGAIDHVLYEPGNGAIARLTTKGAMPVLLTSLPADGLARALSPLAVATAADGVVSLESGASPLVVALRPDLYATLAAGEGDSLPEPVRAMLFSARLWVTEQERASREFRQWDASDLWFHRRVAESRGNDGYGGTYHLEGDFAPLPYEKAAPGPVLDLPVPDLDRARREDPSLAEVMESRRTYRSFAAGATGIEALAALLYRSLRARQVHPDDHGLEVVDRPYPSGGSIHEIETYVVVNDVTGLAPGVYRYAPTRHQLDDLGVDDRLRLRIGGDVQRTTNSEVPPPVILLFGARFGRLMWKYEGMPYALLTKHVGVVYQTIYLNAAVLGLGVCGIGGCSAGLFAQATGTDPLDEGAVGMMALGAPDLAEPDPWGRS